MSVSTRQMRCDASRESEEKRGRIGKKSLSLHSPPSFLLSFCSAIILQIAILLRHERKQRGGGRKARSMINDFVPTRRFHEEIDERKERALPNFIILESLFFRHFLWRKGKGKSHPDTCLETINITPL